MSDDFDLEAALALPGEPLPRGDVIPIADFIDDVDALPDVTPAQMEFIGGVAAGMSASDAYRRAFPDETAAMGTTQVWRNAMLLRTNSACGKWLHLLAQNDVVRQVITPENHIAELDEAKRMAVEAGQFAPVVRAIELKGKTAGLYVDRQHVMVEQRDPTEVLDQIANVSPALAKKLAERAGVAWSPPVAVRAMARQE